MTRLQTHLFAFLLCFLLLFTACQSSPASSGGVDEPQSTASEPSAAETATLTARIVDISGNLLLLAGEDDGVYRGERAGRPHPRHDGGRHLRRIYQSHLPERAR